MQPVREPPQRRVARRRRLRPRGARATERGDGGRGEDPPASLVHGQDFDSAFKACRMPSETLLPAVTCLIANNASLSE